MPFGYEPVRIVLRGVHMIQIDSISDNALRITAPKKLKADDFRKIVPIGATTSDWFTLTVECAFIPMNRVGGAAVRS